MANRTYWLESATDLSAPVYSLVWSNLGGQGGFFVCTEANPPGVLARLFRVEVTR